MLFKEAVDQAVALDMKVFEWLIDQELDKKVDNPAGIGDGDPKVSKAHTVKNGTWSK